MKQRLKLLYGTWQGWIGLILFYVLAKLVSIGLDVHFGKVLIVWLVLHIGNHVRELIVMDAAKPETN